jgi:hypothetical protein
MRIGINIDAGKVFLEVTDPGGIKTVVDMDTKNARAVADQLLSSAETLDAAFEEGLLTKDD